MSDQKIDAAKAKPPLGMIPIRALLGIARVFGYGARRYAPGNFHTATLEDGAGERYMSGALRHATEMQLSNGLFTAESLAALDAESGLPHLDHMICGLIMLRSIMVKCGALPADPGVGKDPPCAAPVAKPDVGPLPDPLDGVETSIEEIWRARVNADRCAFCDDRKDDENLYAHPRCWDSLTQDIQQRIMTAFADPWMAELDRGVTRLG